MSEAVSAFGLKLSEARERIPAGLRPEEVAPILSSFPKIEESFAAMAAETGAIFGAFREGDTGRAAERMAAMDARFGEVRGALDEIRRQVSGAQSRELAESLATATESRQIGDAVGVFVLLMVLGVTAYGLRLARQFAASQQKLAERNRDMRLVLDNAEQGFVTVSLTGEIGEERSAALGAWFGEPAPGERFWNWLARKDPRRAAPIEASWAQLQEDWMPIDLALDQLPRRMLGKGRVWEISYRPILAGEKLAQVLAVISDVTAEDERRRMEQGQRDMVGVIERIMRDRFGTLEFIAEAKLQVARLVSESAKPDPETKRALHTLKGNAALFGMQSIANLCHDIETCLEEEGSLPQDLRVELSSRWDDMMYRLEPLIGEVKTRERIAVDTGEHRAVLSMFNQPNSKDAVKRRIEAWEHEPVKRRFTRLAELAQGLVVRLGKVPVSVQQEDNGIRLPAEHWAPFWAALVHAVRNAVDHGLETPEERAAAGKSSTAQLTLRARVEAGEMLIELEDDGRGIQWEKLTERARQKGLPSQTRADLVESLFADGVSTRDEVSDLSGRGIGMGALRASCVALRGRVEIESTPGKGTILRCRWDLANAEGLRWLNAELQRQAS